MRRTHPTTVSLISTQFFKCTVQMTRVDKGIFWDWCTLRVISSRVNDLFFFFLTGFRTFKFRERRKVVGGLGSSSDVNRKWNKKRYNYYLLIEIVKTGRTRWIELIKEVETRSFWLVLWTSLSLICFLFDIKPCIKIDLQQMVENRQ